MLNQFRHARQHYSRQFWWLLWGSLLSATGAAMIWPFLTIYLRQRLDVPLTTVASLLTLNAALGLLASLVAGPVTDRFGRKGVMVSSLMAGVVYFVLMTQVRTLPAYAALIGAWGAFSPLFSVGANAMIADLIPSEQRTDAYALLRVIHNVGVAVGPILGGFTASISYTLSFFVAASGYALFSLLVLLVIRETLPSSTTEAPMGGWQDTWAPVFRDRLFLGTVGSLGLTHMVAALMFLLLPVYTKENFGLSESRYGWIVTTNALMCIFLQYGVTRQTKRYRPLPVLLVGALFYALGVGSVALGRSFESFVLSMVIMTTGELIMTPTATALAAEMAPLEMRGRYMSVYGFTWGVGAGLGPVIGGALGDQLGPRAIWYGGALFGLLSALGFGLLIRPFQARQPAVPLSQASVPVEQS